MKATGTLNAVAEYVEIDIRPEDNSVLAQITGTWVGTLVPMVQAETDGPWVECRWLNTDADAPSENTDANGNFQFLRVAGAQKARVYMSAYTSGDAVVALRGSRGMGALEPSAGGASEATMAAAAASLAIMDDWDESDRAKVNPIVGQAGVAAGAGAVGATVQRVTLASDDPLVEVHTRSVAPGEGAEKNVTTAGNQVQLTATPTPCVGVWIRCKSGNTGNIYVGGANVGSTNAIPFPAGTFLQIACQDASDIWLDSSVNGEGVHWQPVVEV